MTLRSVAMSASLRPRARRHVSAPAAGRREYRVRATAHPGGARTGCLGRACAHPEFIAEVPAPGSDHRKHEPPTLRERNLIDVRIARADLLRHVGNIKLGGSTAARFQWSAQLLRDVRGESAGNLRGERAFWPLSRAYAPRRNRLGAQALGQVAAKPRCAPVRNCATVSQRRVQVSDGILNTTSSQRVATPASEVWLVEHDERHVRVDRLRAGGQRGGCSIEGPAGVYLPTCGPGHFGLGSRRPSLKPRRHLPARLGD
jgi:hypothetical protein